MFTLTIPRRNILASRLATSDDNRRGSLCGLCFAPHDRGVYTIGSNGALISLARGGDFKGEWPEDFGNKQLVLPLNVLPERRGKETLDKEVVIQVRNGLVSVNDGVDIDVVDIPLETQYVDWQTAIDRFEWSPAAQEVSMDARMMSLVSLIADRFMLGNPTCRVAFAFRQALDDNSYHSQWPVLTLRTSDGNRCLDVLLLGLKE